MDFNQDFEDSHHQENQGGDQIPDYGSNTQQQQGFGNENIQSETKQTKKEEKKDLGSCPFLKVEYYQPYFDVDTSDVLGRMKTALLPIKPEFFEISRDKPDLWGPFWIFTSIAFIIPTVGNIFRFLSSSNKADFTFNYKFFPQATLLIYLIGFGTPLLLTIIMKCFGNKITVFQSICLYGYSMAVYLPVILFCLIPFTWLQWIFVSIGTLISIAFMLINMHAEFAAYQQNKKYMMYGVLVGVQVLFMLFLKLHFLKKSNT